MGPSLPPKASIAARTASQPILFYAVVDMVIELGHHQGQQSLFSFLPAATVIKPWLRLAGRGKNSIFFSPELES